MRILVTGANGYLGQGIVKVLLDRGNEVIATDITTTYVDTRAERIDSEIFQIIDPYKKLGKPEVLLHLAWKDGFIHNSSVHLDMLSNHVKFIEKMAKSDIQMISAMGTMHEIGFYEGCINENTPCNPSTRYGIAKDAFRRFVKLICEENSVVFQWLRGYYIVGNALFGASIFSKIAAAEARGDKEFPFTAGVNQYDFLNYDNFCEQTAAAAGQTRVNGIINICSGYPEKLCERVERFIKDNGYKIRLAYGKFPDREYDSKAVWGDDRKIREIMRA